MKLFSDILPTYLNKAGEWLVEGGATLQESIGGTGSTLSERVGGVVKKIIRLPKKVGEAGVSLLAKQPGMQVIASIAAGQPVLESLKTRFQEPETQVQIATEREQIRRTALTQGKSPEEALRISKSSITPTLASKAESAVFGFMGGMKTLKGLIPELQGAETTLKASNILRKAGVADDLINVYAPKFAETTDKKVVQEGIISLESAMKTTKAVLPKAEVGAVERGFITSIKETFPEVKVAGQYISRSTDELAIKARNLVKDNIVSAEKLARTGVDDNAVATASELIKHYNEVGQFEKAAEIAHNIAAKLTEQGRAVQAASILGRLTPEGQLKFAASEINRFNEVVVAKRGGLLGLQKKIPELTGEQSKHILNESKTIQEMPDGIEKAMRFQKLQNYISDLVPSPLYQKLIAVWKAGLLTGIKTSGLNSFSNLFHGASEIIKDVPAVGIDKIISLFTKERTLALTARGIKGGAKEGVEKGWRYLRMGFDERNIGIKLDWKRVNFGKSKFAKGIQTYEETVFHLMGAEDQPFYYGAKARSLYSQAIAQGKNKGLSGSKLRGFVNDLVGNPTDDMLKYATIDAETAVFQNKTVLGDIAKAIQRAPGGEVVVPFGRTPSAVATQIINYSPVGIVKTIAENIGKGRFDQRLFSQGIGRGMTGTGTMYIGYELFNKGLLTLGRPKGEKEQKLWEIEGRKENSFYDPITKSWRSVQVLGPLGPTLLMGGYFKQGIDSTGSPTEAIATTLTGTAKSFTEQTFLRGMSTAIEAVVDPSRSFETFFTSLAGSTVPTIIADLARATDVVERKNQGPLERLKSRIPFLREELEPSITVLGGEVPRYGGNPLESMIDPSRPSEIKDTPVVNELRRLWDVGYKVSPTLLGDKGGYEGLTPEQNTDLWKRAGEITNSKLNNLFIKEEYKKLGDDEKAKVVENFIDKSKLFARTEKVLQLTEGLKGQELITKLSELKKSGLMTRDVLNEYQRLR